MKVKFGKKTIKRSDGFIETETIAYVNVTKIISNLFDNVKRAILILDTYYSVTPLNEWKKAMREQAAKIKDNDIWLQTDGQYLYIEFNSGKMVNLFTSEYGWLSSLKEMPTIN